jgi:hypothetical protein
LGAERPGLGGAPYLAGAKGGSSGWEQSGRALAARPTRPEQKAAAAAGRSWRWRLGAEGGGGGWEPGPKNRVAGKEENISGSIYGGIRCNFDRKLKEAHFSLFLSFISMMGFHELLGTSKLIFKTGGLFWLPTF